MKPVFSRRHRRLTCSAGALLMIASSGALCADWVQAEQGSTLQFEGMAQGESFVGKFGKFETRLSFDADSPSTGTLSVDIDLSSVDSANAERDELIVSNDFFAVEQSSRAHFEAAQFRREGDGYLADGKLTLKGVTKAVPFHFSWSPSADGKSAVLEGKASLDRIDFGVGAGDWADEDMIGRSVKVITRVAFTPAG